MHYYITVYFGIKRLRNWFRTSRSPKCYWQKTFSNLFITC